MVDADGLSVSVRTEDGDTKVFEFRPLVAAFAKVSGPAGTWRQMATGPPPPNRRADGSPVVADRRD